MIKRRKTMRTLIYFLSLLLCVSSAFAIGKVGPAQATFTTCVKVPIFVDPSGQASDCDFDVIKGTTVDETYLNSIGKGRMPFLVSGLNSTTYLYYQYHVELDYTGTTTESGLTIQGRWIYNTGSPDGDQNIVGSSIFISPYYTAGDVQPVDVTFIVTEVNATADDIEIRSYDFPVTITVSASSL